MCDCVDETAEASSPSTDGEAGDVGSMSILWKVINIALYTREGWREKRHLHATRGVHNHAWNVGRRCRRGTRGKTPQATRGMHKHACVSGHNKDRLDRGGTKLTNSSEVAAHFVCNPLLFAASTELQGCLLCPLGAASALESGYSTVAEHWKHAAVHVPQSKLAHRYKRGPSRLTQE